MSVTKKYKEDLVTGAAIRDGKGRNIANQLDGKHPTIDADHPLSASLVSGLPKGNVQADWNATEGDAQILNKPTLFSGSYNDLTDKPTIPTIPASLPADGGNADTVDGKHAADFIQYKTVQSIEYDGAVDGQPVAQLRQEIAQLRQKVSYYKTIMEV